MAEFFIAVVLFFIAHVVPPAPPVRKHLIAWLGRRGYLASYSALSVVLIAWVVIAAREAPYVQLWSFAPWQTLVPVLVMPFAAWLLVAGFAEANPLSISMLSADHATQLGPAAAVTRHPLLWAFLLWAASHIVPNGNVVSLILFGGMSLLAIAGFVMIDRRSQQRLGEKRWRALAATTSIVPFVAILTGRARVRLSMRLFLSATVALAVYFWFLLYGHRQLIGLDPLIWFRS